MIPVCWTISFGISVSIPSKRIVEVLRLLYNPLRRETNFNVGISVSDPSNSESHSLSYRCCNDARSDARRMARPNESIRQFRCSHNSTDTVACWRQIKRYSAAEGGQNPECCQKRQPCRFPFLRLPLPSSSVAPTTASDHHPTCWWQNTCAETLTVPRGTDTCQKADAQPMVFARTARSRPRRRSVIPPASRLLPPLLGLALMAVVPGIRYTVGKDGGGRARLRLRASMLTQRRATVKNSVRKGRRKERLKDWWNGEIRGRGGKKSRKITESVADDC